MPYTIATLKNDAAARLHGTTINSIQNFYGLCNQAASDILLRIDPQETKRIVETPPIFNGVWDYAAPVDLKGNRVIDLRPQFTRYPNDVWTQSYNQAFDLTKNNMPFALQPDFTINFNTGLKSLRINSPNLTPGVVISYVNNVNSNGTWTAGGDASNIQQDQINFIVGGSSLSFDLSGVTGTGYLENTTLESVNIAEQINQATEFLYTFMPTALDFTSVEYRWGSDISNYYKVTQTMTQENTVFQNAWNLLDFPWLGAIVVGSPDPSNITYVRVTWNYTVGQPQTAVRLNGISSILPRVLEMEYYSKYMFRNALGAFKESVTSDTDIVNLDTEAYMIYLNRFLFLASQQKQGVDASIADGPFFNKEYEAGIARYTALYKSEVQKPASQYYTPTNNNYGRFMGRPWFF
jgi:hypothetical protein